MEIVHVSRSNKVIDIPICTTILRIYDADDSLICLKNYIKLSYNSTYIRNTHTNVYTVKRVYNDHPEDIIEWS